MSEDLVRALRPEAREAPPSGIVAAFNYSRGRDKLIPLLVGEGDLPTPQFICDAVTRSLKAGETFYTWQRGIPELRAALARYHTRHFGRTFPADRFFITGGGMQAIQIAIACVAGAGDDVIIPSPAWPNFAGAVSVAGGRPNPVPLDFESSRWSLDLDKLFAAAGPRTKAIFMNSPANPTGWTASETELRAILAFARERNLWIVADEVYNRFFYGRARAPSFYDIAAPGDRILYVNTFSKNWAMTGWRIGWISAPEALGAVIENLIQYSTSGVAAFMQRGAIAALEEGEDFVKLQVERARVGRDIVCSGLSGSNRVRLAWPDGAFYLLFEIADAGDTSALAVKLVDEAGLVLAPGAAFGQGGASFLRICFERSAADLQEATRRLTGWLGS
jgi:aspartate/methionine/tyrosine aminotransferase